MWFPKEYYFVHSSVISVIVPFNFLGALYTLPQSNLPKRKFWMTIGYIA